MDVVTVEGLVQDQKGHIRNWAQVHEFLELQRIDIGVHRLQNILHSHNAEEDESWQEEFQHIINRGKFTWGRVHIRVSLSELFPPQGLDEEYEPNQSGLRCDIVIVILHLVEFVCHEERPPHHDVISPVLPFALGLCFPIY